MRTANYRDDVIFPAARLLGIDPTIDLLIDHAAAFNDSANAATRKGWAYWDFPDLTVTEERAFRPIWRNDVQFRKVGINGGPDEVFYLPTFSYYQVLSTAPTDPPVGTVPTNATYYAPLDLVDKYIDLDQNGRRAIGDILGIYANNPRAGGVPIGLNYMPSERGIDVAIVAGMSAFVHYRIRASKFTTVPYDNAKTYFKGDLFLAADGNCYRAIRQVIGIPAPNASYYRLQPMPETISEFVKYMIAADASEDAQTKAGFENDAEYAIIAEVNRLLEAGQKHHYSLKRSRRCTWVPFGLSGFWWSVSPPYSGNGASVTTLTDTWDENEPADYTVMRTEDQYLSWIDSLTGSATSLDHYDTRYLATESQVHFAFGTPANEQWFRLKLGTADPTDPTNQVAALNSDGTAAARYWQQVGGY